MPAISDPRERRIYVLKLRARGFSLTHIAGLAGITPRRVSQIIAEGQRAHERSQTLTEDEGWRQLRFDWRLR